MTALSDFTLPTSWERLEPYAEQVRLWNSPVRFPVVAAGRRSGKTVRGKQKGSLLASGPQSFPDERYIFCAPTRDQAKRIFWDDLKQLIPPWAKSRTYEGDLLIRLWNSAIVMVVGMDKPQRIEGVPIKWFLFDEYGEARPEAWTSTLRPACSTVGREGGGWFIGRPKGRNHFYKLFKRAQDEAADAIAQGKVPSYDAFHWTSEDVLSIEEIMAAKRDLDPLTYGQEYLAEFLNFDGRVYYAYDPEVHASELLSYDPDRPLVLAFDFNVQPGICAYIQEQYYVGRRPEIAPNYTAVFGECWIERDSTTEKVCRQIIRDFGPNGRFPKNADGHRGEVLIYGDATGGARGSAKVKGSDWALVKQHLVPVFGARLKFRVPKANPRERARVNAMNSRLLAADGTVKMLVDPVEAVHVGVDLEGVTWSRGVFDEIDKKGAPDLTHLSDAIGYYIERKFPIEGGGGLSGGVR